jgi:hypothetical protein
MQIGKYDVSVEHENFNIYPKDKDGETMCVPVERIKFNLHHTSGEVVTFKRYLHAAKWYWNDSREKGPCGEQHVLSEVARMLFDGDSNKAINMLVAGIRAA